MVTPAAGAVEKFELDVVATMISESPLTAPYTIETL